MTPPSPVPSVSSAGAGAAGTTTTARPSRRTQSSLDSFFGAKPVGAAASKKGGPKQKKIETFFKTKPDSSLDALPKATAEVQTKESAAKSVITATLTSTPTSTQQQRLKRRRVIQEDDESESDLEMEMEINPLPVDQQELPVVSVTPSSTNAEETTKTTEECNTMETSQAIPHAATHATTLATTHATGTRKTTTTATTGTPTVPSVSLHLKPPLGTDGHISSIRKSDLNGSHSKTDESVLGEITSETWMQDGADMPYSVLCQAFGKIEAITSRLAIQQIMTTLFRQIMLKSCFGDMSAVVYLASNSVAAAYECVELGIGDAILIKAIGQATGTTTAMVKQKYEKAGDLGSVAQDVKGKQPKLIFAKKTKACLSAKKVLQTFRQIAETKGNQSQKLKVGLIKTMLVDTTDKVETKYIIRGLQGKLRIGLAQSTVLISLAHALALTTPPSIAASVSNIDMDDYPNEAKQYVGKSLTPEKRLDAAVAIVKKAYSEVPSYDAILDAAWKFPLEEFHKVCTLTPGIPVAPMLAKPTKSVQEVLTRLNGLRFTCEYKYDGERAQVHMLPDGTTKVFSRNLLDTSEKYPEVPPFVKEACREVESFVLDAEVVAFNPKTGQLVPFQILSTRKKTEESAETAKVQVIVQGFDLMYLNGKSLLNNTLAERRELMLKHFVPVEGKFQFAQFIDLQENGDTTVLEEFLESAVKGQCEGLMVKTLDVNAIYEPSRRSLNWLKLKKDYLEGLGDSVDLVPLGAYHGRGKRTGVYGAYLLACYDPETEEFQSVCKIGTGFSDEDLKTLSDSLNEHKIPMKSSQYSVSDQLECDVWFDAVQVWEVKAADLSKSSVHRGADGKTGEAGRGIGLRFPRFERLREDKRPSSATTSDQILEMYYQQDSIVAGGNDEDDDEEGI